MSELLNKAKTEMSEKELQDLEEYEFEHGPMKLLTQAVQKNTTVLISLRNNHKLIAKVKAFDRHCNMILENVKEIWNEPAPNDKKKKVLRERFVLKMFLRGDSVIVILNHNETGGK
ncbi:mRNA splicing protein [Brettanomyces nanus]|uniref:Small nuclear ribonucleoprotein Sm D2 n=1 Tax=Eeniella nana TaxID=13502 RepID=A0A875RMX6_EENNA|nr:mRNA splicing protein [Brettanomyces nanus]QPG72850.1 mRNA splicing protein [Brettanomyces nanus]